MHSYQSSTMLKMVLPCLLLGTICGAQIDDVAAKESAKSMQASTSQLAQREALRAIPLERMAPPHRRAVQRVLNDCSLYRRLPTGVVACQPDLFTWLMLHPETLVEIWRELGISNVDLERTGANSFRLSDNAGTTAQLSIVEQKCQPGAQNRIVMLADGAYDGKPFQRPIHAQCVLLLRSGSFQETNEKDYVAARLDTFVRVERTGVKLFAKALHPWVGKTADKNFLDTLQFVGNLSETACRHPERVRKLVVGLPGTPLPLRQELLRVAGCDSATASVQQAQRIRPRRK